MRAITRSSSWALLAALALALLLAHWTPASPGQPLLAQHGAAANALANDSDDNGDLDHFKCYATSGSSDPDARVTLEDQFGKSENEAVGRDSRFCNPTKKTHAGKTTPIRNPAGHLTFYSVDATGQRVPAQLAVHNQFGLQTVFPITGSGDFLAVPSEKGSLGEVEDLDHFLCYTLGGTGPNEPVVLEDQFDREAGRVEAITVGNPRLFCNPVEKTRTLSSGRTEVSPIGNPEAHLLCYDFSPVRPELRTVPVRNQFGDQSLQTLVSDRLCVPTVKCEPQDDRDNDGLIDSRETLLGTLLGLADSDLDGIKDGNDDANRNGLDDEDEDDNDGCPDRDSDDDGTDDEDEDD